MKLYPHNLLADAKEERRQGERAFTMVEIAISIGVIGFALVAVIGILPAGMNVQKDNREDTTISQDAPFFLDAIRNGANLTNNNQSPILQGLDFLSNYVEKISLIGVTNGVIGQPFASYSNLESGAQILGLLSTPNGIFASYSNYIFTRSIVRSLSGAAVQQNGANQLTAFRYQMDIEIVPFVNVAPDSTNFLYYYNLGEPTNSPDVANRFTRYLEVNPFPFPLPSPFALPQQTVTNLPYGVGAMSYNCFDVRMHFSWPVLPNGSVGPGRQNYRTTIASALVTNSAIYMAQDRRPVWFFLPQQFTNVLTL